MYRVAGAAVAVLSFVAPANASLSSPVSTDRSDEVRALRAAILPPKAEPAPAADSGPELELTAATQVYLDGKRCEYKDVPTTATVSKVDVAKDRKTILRIEFTSKK